MASMNELPIFPMNAGSGAYSYAQNSSYQGGAFDAAMSIIKEEIVTKLNIKHLARNTVFIADFGSSTGHNSFQAMQAITQTIHQIHESAEFHVIFNDIVTNDFNTIFTSLPPDRIYLAAGVPGDFHKRLLPKSSIHFGYSSMAIHWLSRVPEAVMDSGSLAWNKGAIYYIGSKKEVCEAYLDQFSKDMEAFLDSRAVEMVGGGLLAFLIQGVPQYWNPDTEYTLFCDIKIMASCLVELAKLGRLSEAKVDSFNIPVYSPTPQQLKAILNMSKSYIIERMEILKNPKKYVMSNVDARAAFVRAGTERLYANHFGEEITDELFELYKKKLAASPVFLNPANDRSIVHLVILKRKAN